jgi:hypothetical protein
MLCCRYHRCCLVRFLAAGIWLATVAGPGGPAACGQGSLDQLRDAVRLPSMSDEDATEGESEKPRGKTKRGDTCHDGTCHLQDRNHGGDDSGLVTLAAYGVFGVVTTPFWGPRVLVDDDSIDPACFTCRPYCSDFPGCLVTDKSILCDEYRELDDDQYQWLLRTRVEYGADFDDLSRSGGQVLLDTACRFGLDAEVNEVRECRPSGCWDRLWLGDCNLVYRFAQSPRVQMRSGVGFSWMADTLGSDFGFNFTYGGDFYVRKPWVLSADIDWGRLGHAALFHGRATVGVQFRRVEVYTGYDYYDVGHVPIGGLVGGLRYWY